MWSARLVSAITGGTLPPPRRIATTTRSLLPVDVAIGTTSDSETHIAQKHIICSFMNKKKREADEGLFFDVWFCHRASYMTRSGHGNTRHNIPLCYAMYGSNKPLWSWLKGAFPGIIECWWDSVLAAEHGVTWGSSLSLHQYSRWGFLPSTG